MVTLWQLMYSEFLKVLIGTSYLQERLSQSRQEKLESFCGLPLPKPVPEAF